MKDAFYIIPHIAGIILSLGFIGFLIMISPGIRKMLKRNRKIRRRLKGIKVASKARDYQI
jgi:hypothetical protein